MHSTKTLLKAHKVRLYPNAEQTVQIEKTFGCARFTWNQMLALQQERYKNGEKHLSNFDMQNQIVLLKNDYEWLRDVDSRALKEVCRALDEAYRRFFKKQGGFPKFKSKHQNRQSYTNTRGESIHLQPNKINSHCLVGLSVVAVRIRHLAPLKEQP